MALKSRLLLWLPFAVLLPGSLCKAEAPPNTEVAQAPTPGQGGSGQQKTAAAQPAVPAVQSPLPSLADLVEAVKGSVVNVDVQSRVSSRAIPGHGGDMFERFFGMPGGSPMPREQYRQGAGSGVVIDPKGLILTNNHVVEGAVAIRVKFDDGRELDAEILGRDPLTDIALIKLKGKFDKLPVARLGDSDAIRVGDWVVAIGNPFGLASSVSTGILSARSRNIGATRYDDFLQTDAAINPGNSGGPLFNLKGEVIGINTAIIGGGTGIGFAVPANMVKALLPQLESKGAVTRGYVGIYIQDLTPELAKALKVPATKGAIVTGFNEENSPGKRAGLRADDVIVAIDGQPVESSGALTRSVALKAPKSSPTFTIYRGGDKKEIKVQLEALPDSGLVAERSDADRSDERQLKIGIELRDLDPRLAQAMGVQANSGAQVVNVVPTSPAERAGIQAGDIIVEAGGKPVRTARDLLSALRSAKSGSTVLLRVQGQGGARSLRALQIP